jgi:hypothetical protein
MKVLSTIPVVAFMIAIASPADATMVLTPVSLSGAAATTSSDPFGFAPTRAIDGQTNGVNPDFTHTNNGANEWWRVALPANADVDVIRVFNRTDCCSGRINGAVLRVYGDVGLTSNLFTGPAFAGSPRITDFNLGSTLSSRVIEVSHQNEYLSLAEVQLFTKTDVSLPLGTNLSHAGIANLQASMSSAWGGGDFASGGQYPAEYALDNITGDPGNFTHTQDGATGNQFWKANLGEAMQIQQVNIENRVGCCPERLRDITVTVLDGAGTPVWTSALLNPGNVDAGPAVIALNIQALNGGTPIFGNQVLITRTSTGATHDGYILAMSEVNIIGGSVPEPAGFVFLGLGLSLAAMRRKRSIPSV